MILFNNLNRYMNTKIYQLFINEIGLSWIILSFARPARETSDNANQSQDGQPIMRINRRIGH